MFSLPVKINIISAFTSLIWQDLITPRKRGEHAEEAIT